MTPPAVLIECLDQFKKDWFSKTCPNCGNDKWKNSPFCRRCSIRLQRKNLIGGFKTWTGHSMAANIRFFCKDGYVYPIERWIRWYDRCRDYLGVSEHERNCADAG
jgi:hypothetical protein